MEHLTRPLFDKLEERRIRRQYVACSSYGFDHGFSQFVDTQPS
jgi:hypothetical protein